MLFSASKSSLKTRAGWLRSSRGCCGLNVLTHKMGACFTGRLQALTWGAGSCRACRTLRPQLCGGRRLQLQYVTPSGSLLHGALTPVGASLKGMQNPWRAPPNLVLLAAPKAGCCGGSQVSAFPFALNMVTLSHFKMKYYVYLACLGLNTFPA